MAAAKFPCAVVSAGSGPVTGIVGETVLVLPNMAPEHATKLLDPKLVGVVAEVGGQLCHFAIVAREQGVPVLVLPDATTVLLPGCTVHLDTRRLLIQLL